MQQREQKQSRRSILRNAATLAAAGLITAGNAKAQSAAPLEKKDAKAKPGAAKPAKAMTRPVYTDVVSFGSLLFLAGKSQHTPGPIEEHTKFVLDTLEQNLIASGSSLRKVLKVNVFLKNIEADINKMNAVYVTRDWGDIPPPRTTTSSPGGFPSTGALIMMDCIAYV
jgi:2-iminobutanoate/2-iminopropanoate deaminase